MSRASGSRFSKDRVNRRTPSKSSCDPASAPAYCGLSLLTFDQWLPHFCRTQEGRQLSLGATSEATSQGPIPFILRYEQAAAAASATAWSCSPLPPLTPTAPTIWPFTLIGMPPAKVITPAVVRCVGAEELVARLAVAAKLERSDIERLRGEGLVDGDVDAAKPHPIHAHESHEIGAGIDDGDIHRLADLLRLRFFND